MIVEDKREYFMQLQEIFASLIIFYIKNVATKEETIKLRKSLTSDKYVEVVFKDNLTTIWWRRESVPNGQSAIILRNTPFLNKSFINHLINIYLCKP
jgi:CMP-2-keto-3-deoxyoctulosonic acid synthetase